MKESTRRLHDVMRGETVAYVGLGGSVASIISLVGWAYTQLPKQWFGLVALSVLALSLLALVAVASFYSVRVRQENRALRRSHEVLHAINHNYRDVLSEAFGEEQKTIEERAEIEKETLRSVCEALSRLFLAFTHVPCTITVKLIIRGKDGVLYARTLARSDSMCGRDKVEPFDFQLKTGKNTGLDQALVRIQGQVSHFFSPDLYLEADRDAYYNERPNWKACYRSAIVVPIRHVTGQKDYHGWVSDNLGFLTVDTLSENRLSNTYQVQMLAAYADQMYNFMSLMRGKYSVTPQPREPQPHQESQNAN